MSIAHTRAMVTAALSGALDDATFRRDPLFNVDVPVACPEVPAHVLNPRETWSHGADYDVQAQKLAAMFVENFRNFEDEADDDVRAAGPQPGA